VKTGVESQESKPRYFIDLQWYEANDRSFPVFVQSRMCPSCQSKLGTEEERSVPVENGSGKVVFETKKVPYGDDPLVIIRDCCAKAEDFFTPNLPIMEIIFRIFLTNANQPLALEEIKELLDERLATAERPRTISLETLERLLDNDRYYGLRRFPATETGESNSA